VPCPVFAGFALAFVLLVRKKHGKTSVQVVEVKIHKHTIRIHRHNNENTLITVLNRNTPIYTLIKKWDLKNVLVVM